METVDRQPGDWKRFVRLGKGDRKVRSALVALAAGVVLLLLVGATNSVVSSARAISHDASALSETDEAVRASTVARTLTVLAAVAVNDGTTAPSLDEIDKALTVLDENKLEDAPTAGFITAVDDLVASISTGETARPEQVASVENEFRSLLEAQLDRREALADSLAASEERMNAISSLAGLALLFVVPTLAIAVYRGLTKPDLDHAAYAHTADIQARHQRNQLGAVAGGLAGLRSELGRDLGPKAFDQRMAELVALAGVGADGSMRRRKALDIRMVAATAVNRMEAVDSVPIEGDRGAIVADEDQVVTLVAALVRAVSTLPDPRIRIRRDERHLALDVTTARPFAVEEVLAEGALWDHPASTPMERQVGAARALAVDLGVGLVPIVDGARWGFRVLLEPADDLGADVLNDPTRLSATPS